MQRRGEIPLLLLLHHHLQHHMRKSKGIYAYIHSEVIFFNITIPQYFPIIQIGKSKYNKWELEVYYTVDESMPHLRTLFASSIQVQSEAFKNAINFRTEIRETFKLFKPIPAKLILCKFSTFDSRVLNILFTSLFFPSRSLIL